MAIRTATKLTAGVGATVYTVPAGKSATVSVQVQNPNGFILAAQQTAISANPLISTVNANTINASAIPTFSSTTYYVKNSTRTVAFSATNGSLVQNGALYTFSTTGSVTATTFNLNIYAPPPLDYRIGASFLWVFANDTNYGGVRVLQMTSNVITNYTVNPTSTATARTASFDYYSVGAVVYSDAAIGFRSDGAYSRSNAFGTPSTSSGMNSGSTTDPVSGGTNNMYSFMQANSYTIGFQAMDAVIRDAGNGIGLFVGLYKTGGAPAIITHSNWSNLVANGVVQDYNPWVLSGPANGTCPMWVRFFNGAYYFGMSDNTLWKTTTAIYQYAGTGSSTSRGTVTCTQITVPADVNITTRPYVASATQMMFGTTGTFPKVLTTSDTFVDYPNATYPTELSFASATVPNPKIITKNGSTVNDYIIVDTTNVYKTVPNYSTLGAESYLVNGRTGDFERTGLVLNSGDKLIAVEPTDDNCIVTVYGYEE